MSSHTRSRKRQSRLAFTPLSSSSPAAKDYNKQIQDRAAAVTLESSPMSSKRRKIDAQLDGVNDSFPTPAATNQRRSHLPITEEDSESEEPIRSTQRTHSNRHRKTARQQRLNFTNVRDADSFSPPMKLSSPSRPQSSARVGMFGTQKKRTVVDISSDEGSGIDANENDKDIEIDSDEELPSPAKLVAKPKAKKHSKNEESRNHRKATRSTQPISVESDSDENIVVNNRPADPIAVESDDDDDDMPTTFGTQRRQRGRRRSRNSFISSSPLRVVDSDSEIEIIKKPKNGRRKGISNSNEEEPATPRRLKPRKKVSQREKEDLAEDLDFLEPSSDVESPRKKRDTQSQKKNARQQALDKLKRRRSKQVEIADGDDDGDGDEEQASFDELYDDDDRHGHEPAPLKSSQMFREDEWDEGFIEEEDDDDNPLGIPDGVPLEFTRYASMKPEELFKYAVEWFVQKKINPAFSRNDGIYDLTFRKLDDEVSGLAGSKFKSSAWTPSFTMALNSRPQIAYDSLDSETVWMHNTCDACNRTNHPATYQVQFQGKPYHRETLEDVGSNDDDDSDNDIDSSSETSDTDAPSYDAQGRQVPPESTIYYVGKFCMSNARTAHSLQHWKHHLNEWVVAWLDKEEYNTPEQIVRRDRWDTAKRRKYANKIADRMESEGVVKTLFSDFRDNVKEARDSKQGRYGGTEE